MARRRRGRPIDGILLLDKPVGLTSNQVLQRAKRLFDAAKAGHTGSLDPLASGLLPLCFGHATKLSGYLLDADKRYRVSARFGARTATADAEGEVVEENAARPDAAALDAALVAFRGPIEQVPPMYSAIKQGGQRLYKLARQGISVERKARPVTIHALTLTAFDGDTLSLEVSCSKGTYIRTLVEDIAGHCGALAHVTRLRRTAAGPYGPEGLVTFETLEALDEAGRDALLLPLDSALGHLPAVTLGADLSWYLLNGQPVAVPGAPRNGKLRLYADDGKFLGIGETTEDGRVAPRRLFR